MIKRLPISVGILSWQSKHTLLNTLFSYKKNNLFDIVEDVTIFFNEISENDKIITDIFDVSCLGSFRNLGIGKGYFELAKNAKCENILLLEHDWELIENKEIIFNRLKQGINLLNSEISTVRFRHRNNPGYPLWSKYAYEGKELEHYDPVIDLISPHLLDTLHWKENPHELYPDKIQKQNEHYLTTSRWANFTNNPCLYKKDFYLQVVDNFKGEFDLLENNISYWWARQNFKVAQGEGLFTHNDIQKYGI